MDIKNQPTEELQALLTNKQTKIENLRGEIRVIFDDNNIIYLIEKAKNLVRHSGLTPEEAYAKFKHGDRLEALSKIRTLQDECTELEDEVIQISLQISSRED